MHQVTAFNWLARTVTQSFRKLYKNFLKRLQHIERYLMFTEHSEKKPMKCIVADICDTEAIDEAFCNVDVVFHCAAFINFQYPPNLHELERVNVDGKL